MQSEESILAGKTIVVTRDEKGNRDFAGRIERLGAAALTVETIRVRPLPVTRPLIEAMERLGDYDWVVLTSVNGVNLFFELMDEVGVRRRFDGRPRFACIGQATGKRLAEFGYRCDLTPKKFTSAALGREMVHSGVSGARVLLLRSSLASEELVEILASAGAKVDSIALYDIDNVDFDAGGLGDAVSGGSVDWLTFASPSSARAIFSVLDADMVRSSRARIASIGPVTSKQLREIGIRVDIEAAEHTIDGLIAAMESVDD